MDGLTAFPNPVTEKLEIRILEAIGSKLETSGVILIYNMLGDLVSQSEIYYSTAGNKSEMSVDVTTLKAGLYWLEISSAEIILRAKFVKE